MTKKKTLGRGMVTRPSFSRKDRFAVRCLLQGKDPFGQEVACFEEELARTLNVPWVETVVNATMAYFLILKGLGIGPGDRVIVPAYTFVSAANIPAFLGAELLFADIIPSVPCLDPKDMEKKWDSSVKAVLYVSSFGHAEGLEEVLSFCREKNVPLIHDAAASFGSEISQKPLAALGDYAFTSFHFKKVLSAFEGGALWGKGNPLVFRSLKNHGKKKDFEEPGLNLRLSDLHAALGRSQLKSLPRRLKRRDILAQAYFRELSGIGDIILPVFPQKIKPAWHQMIILTSRKTALAEFLARRGITSTEPAQYIPGLPFFKENGLSCPHALAYHQKALSLPFYEEMTVKEIRNIGDSIRSFFS